VRSGMSSRACRDQVFLGIISASAAAAGTSIFTLQLADSLSIAATKSLYLTALTAKPCSVLGTAGNSAQAFATIP